MEKSAGNPVTTVSSCRHDDAHRVRGDPYDPVCCSDEIVWVQRRIDPIDPRFTAPVGRYRVLLPDYRTIPAPEDPAWHRAPEYQQSQFWRPWEKTSYVTQRNSRSEEWSTLRQMLPSRGYFKPSRLTKWGIEAGRPPSPTDEPQLRFPQIRSPMSKYEQMTHLYFSIRRPYKQRRPVF